MKNAVAKRPHAHWCHQFHFRKLLVLVTICANMIGQPVNCSAFSSREVDKDEQGRIVSVDLDHDDGDTTLQRIGSLTHLVRLNANDSKTTDVGLEQLRGFANLKYLSLDNTKVTMAGLKKSGLLGRLVLLSVDRTRVTLTDRRWIRQAFPRLNLFPLDVGSPRSSDLLRLQGVWIAVSGELDGQPLKREELDDIAITVLRDKLKRKESVLRIWFDPTDPQEQPQPAEIDTSDYEFPFRLDPTQNPKHMDLEIGWSGTGTRTPGGGWENVGKPLFARSIYSVEGDLLRICWGDDTRPTCFETSKNDGALLITYKRTPPEQGNQ